MGFRTKIAEIQESRIAENLGNRLSHNERPVHRMLCFLLSNDLRQSRGRVWAYVTTRGVRLVPDDDGDTVDGAVSFEKISAVNLKGKAVLVALSEDAPDTYSVMPLRFTAKRHAREWLVQLVLAYQAATGNKPSTEPIPL